MPRHMPRRCPRSRPRRRRERDAAQHDRPSDAHRARFPLHRALRISVTQRTQAGHVAGPATGIRRPPRAGTSHRHAELKQSRTRYATQQQRRARNQQHGRHHRPFRCCKARRRQQARAPGSDRACLPGHLQAAQRREGRGVRCQHDHPAGRRGEPRAIRLDRSVAAMRWERAASQPPPPARSQDNGVELPSMCRSGACNICTSRIEVSADPLASARPLHSPAPVAP